MSGIEIEKIRIVHTPGYNLAIPQHILERISNLKLPVSLVLSIPADITPSSVKPEELTLSLRVPETEVQWRVNTVVMQGPTNEDSANNTAETLIMAGSDLDASLSSMIEEAMSQEVVSSSLLDSSGSQSLLHK